MSQLKFGYQPARVELFRQNIPCHKAAEDIGVTYSHLRAAICGRVRPMETVRKELPTYLGVPLEELFNADLLAKEYDEARGGTK